MTLEKKIKDIIGKITLYQEDTDYITVHLDFGTTITYKQIQALLATLNAKDLEFISGEDEEWYDGRMEARATPASIKIYFDRIL